MQPAPLPPNEAERLTALREVGLLDTAAEADFDQLAQRASSLCAAPIALVSLVDEDRQWFKARVGLDAPETSRDLAFCAHAIHGADVFEVEDALADPRFSDNPLVTGDPNIRFYAGVPLRTPEGHALGTLCVIDRVPRSLTGAQREGLSALGRQVSAEIEVRRRIRALARPAVDSTAPGRVCDPMAETTDGDRSAPAPDQPLRFGRFTVLRRIGEGAMATVYAAYDAELDRRVAIKLVHGSGAPETRARVQREAQALARVSHPNVVQIYEIGSFGAQVFVAMELVDGTTLAVWQHLRQRSAAELVRMYVQAGRGLVAAHGVGIVHRDFKPDNVLVGTDGRPRVADFGLARLLGAPAEPARSAEGRTTSVELTRVGAVLGTPAYMSPEQHRGAVVDERSDQFSFCAALYEALYGVRPFPGRTLEEIAARVSAGTVEAPGRSERLASPRVRRALLRGLAGDPAERWPSLAALLDELADEVPTDDDLAGRRSIALALGLGGSALAGVLVYALATPQFLDPAYLTEISGVAAITLGLTALALRETLRRRSAHRHMVRALLFLLGTLCFTRVLAWLAALPIVQIFLFDLVGVGLVLAALSCFVTRALWPAAAVPLAVALAIAAERVPAPAGAVAALVVTVLLFARAWWRAGRAA